GLTHEVDSAAVVKINRDVTSANVRTANAQERLHLGNVRFHKNFSARQCEKNGSLVTEDFDVDSDNVKSVVRDNFAKRIERYNIPFHGMQLRDHVIIVDGNGAAVNYVLQGGHKGLFGKIPPTGHRIEAMSGEVFELNLAVLMHGLTTIT